MMGSDRSSSNVRISVAMTTFNGEKYILKQLDSIRNQTIPPEEVIICDDQSTDNTVEVIKRYITDFQLVNWEIYVNEDRLGWKENFRKAISKTNGEIIFFSDQDDVWLSSKIEKMSNLLINHDMGCLYGTCIKIDSNGREISKQESIEKFNGELKKVEFSPSFYNVGGLGCCMCARRRVIDRYLELNLKEDDHDSQCPRIAVYYDSLWYINMPVIKYRVHSSNTSNVTDGCPFGVSSIDYRIALVRRVLQWLELVEQDESVDCLHKKYIKHAIIINRKRLKYLTQNGSFLSVVKEINTGKIIQSLLGDFAYRHGWNKKLGRLLWRIKRCSKLLQG